MGTTLATLSPPKGARRKPKRVGRGPGSGTGTTAGRGMKGAGSRSGSKKRPWFEGGQLPLQRRLPKRGFKNPFRKEYAAVNLSQLSASFESGSEASLEAIREKGLVPRKAKLVKILGNGELTHPLTVSAHAFSKSAQEKISKAGGSAAVVDPRGV